HTLFRRSRTGFARIALATHPLLPSAHHYGVGSLYFERFHGSIPGPHVPLSTLRPGLYRPLRMTRGRCGSLCLHRMTLPFTTPRRFSSAHNGPLNHSGQKISLSLFSALLRELCALCVRQSCFPLLLFLCASVDSSDRRERA